MAHLLLQLHDDFHHRHYLVSDPLEFVHRYENPWDQEAVALLAALLAYGNVKQVRSSIETLLKIIDQTAESPREFVDSLRRPPFLRQAQENLRPFYHRFNRGEDVVVLLRLLGRSWDEFGSLGGHFLNGLEADAVDIGFALDHLMADWDEWIVEMKLEPRSSFYYFMTSPKDGSTCKRWCMLLRWMGRSDRLDLGLWSTPGPLLQGLAAQSLLKPAQLVIPLDTHTGRISQYLGLTERKSLNFKAAREVTQRLKSVDPIDPTRFDFALSRLGILDLCQRKYRAEICQQCQLLEGCRFARSRRGGRAN